ncbi:hypothetical protein G6F65_020371 [Rhizopus arrhizus]|nr:hypothetical protein G6F65_020371 [Rhizopus arrhizus]
MVCFAWRSSKRQDACHLGVAVLVARVPREGRPVADIERYRPQDLPARDPSNAGVIQLVDVTGLSELGDLLVSQQCNERPPVR